MVVDFRLYSWLLKKGKFILWWCFLFALNVCGHEGTSVVGNGGMSLGSGSKLKYG